MSPAASTRWCPTPEQLMILEEMYRNGLRTPNATQIQQITTHLAFYGRIEGKNVFYWFQNHKARDRQKLRKKLAKQLQEQQLQLQIQQKQEQESMYHRPFYNFNHQNQFLPCDYMSLASTSSSLAYSFHSSALGLPPHTGIGEKEGKNKMMKEVSCNKCNERRGECMTKDMMMMMMMDVSQLPTYPSSLSSLSLPCCNIITNPKPPLKTLELFPVSSSNFKEETKP